MPPFGWGRRTSRATALVNDGRILGNVASQYFLADNIYATVLVHDGQRLGDAAQKCFLTTDQKTVSFTYDPNTGKITGHLTDWITFIGKGYTFTDTTIERNNPAAFTMSHPKAFNGRPIIFNDEGKTDTDPNESGDLDKKK